MSVKVGITSHEYGTLTPVVFKSKQRIAAVRVDCDMARNYLMKIEERGTMRQINDAWISELRATHGDSGDVLLETGCWSDGSL
jgi:hypothetical protein